MGLSNMQSKEMGFTVRLKLENVLRERSGQGSMGLGSYTVQSIYILVSKTKQNKKKKKKIV